MIALMMEAARTSETLVNFYQTTRRYNPEDSHLRSHRRENLKSYLQTSLMKKADIKVAGQSISINNTHFDNVGMHSVMNIRK
jgi:hypothetical protein